MNKPKITHILILILFLLQVKSFASTRYVKQGNNGSGTSWSDAFGSLQEAIAAAGTGDEVWIAEGTYTPSNSGDRWSRFEMKPGLKLYGGFSGTETMANQRDSSLLIHKTILSGEIQNDATDTNNTVNIIRIKDIDNPVYLNSLIIEKAYGADNVIAENFGGINIDASVAYLNHIELRNVKGNFTGALSIHESKVYINHADIHNNAGLFGGGIMIDYSDGPRDPMYISIQNTTLSNNSSDMGGGLYSRLSAGDSLILAGCKINNNNGGTTGGGGLSLESGFVSLNKVEIRSNTVPGPWNGGGGLFMVRGTLIAHDALIADNTIGGEEGGGLFLQELNNAQFINCTFANNKAGTYPGNQFYLVTSDTIAFKNCIVDTVKSQLPDFAPWWGWEYTPNVTFTNCLLGGSFPTFWIDGGNNIVNTDPGFLPTSGYALSDSSQAIDAGNNAFRTVPYTDDLAGNIRISNGIVDIGAYEFIDPSDTSAGIKEAGIVSALKIYPNPATHSILIEGAGRGSSFNIYNIAGRCLLHNAIRKEKQAIDVSALLPGIYLVRLQYEDGRQGSGKFIKR